MCGTCGCDDVAAPPRLTSLDGVDPVDPVLVGPGPALAGHAPDGGTTSRTVVVEERMLARNDMLAEANRRRLLARDVLAINLMGSPGSGKTTLLERTVREFGVGVPIAVVEGDQESIRDAERIRSTGAPVVQINTGRGCHLDAAMIDCALRELEPAEDSMVFIENVGNLVCPALFDLGERARVVLMSVTEGEDKPTKYPHMFAAADLVLLTKCDLLPYLDVEVARYEAQVHRINPRVDVLRVRATPGSGPGLRPGPGLGQWYAWLRAERGAGHRPRSSGPSHGV
ncbi:Ni2+-binding GTPase, urease/hydrogenase maturation protein [Frankia casuarinae]|jgi:hydrogenase nickel incorporation protein HypB|uniref:Hydrogenase accessory protein HypB n=1 Tax=Frankia casuarinae (strain DSM 45818 / CECT 9043 / HFP020203 / CcI3) TaxID=106370 RepID=Q2JBM9_FRACC|nr:MULTISPECIES: hydrogenase nickel incorporation protein HypB [Frankia]ABD11313.1 hydrogenase accessory protein HypB [Frankia casuarinae]EYT90759.1 Ni2+-binding GTPase, urease/hydrogenase maturation protein [Frankia casuarinae]KDA41591.1 Ni2+-binding GTPase, urease/hydrogenase maturation protein [Frankia sp. BMG5.23]KEZ35083.1 hydrogenase accessory protein HypB [Frankia sp. CeD]ORT49133.1 hydrogenase accessory protein HypB [Frankia sp. KB5]